MLDLIHILHNNWGAWWELPSNLLDKCNPCPIFNRWGAVMTLLIDPCNLGKASNNNNNPLTWGHSFLTHHINNPMSGLVMSLQILPPKGAVIINLVGINPGALMPPWDLKLSLLSLSQEDWTLPNKGNLPYHIPTSPKWGYMLSFLAKWAKIPNRGHIRMRTKTILGCLMVILGCTKINILITRTLRTRLHLQNFHFWQLRSYHICQN